jgi:hypothetical protein
MRKAAIFKFFRTESSISLNSFLLDQAIFLLNYIVGVPGSNIDWDTVYTKIFSWFIQAK